MCLENGLVLVKKKKNITWGVRWNIKIKTKKKTEYKSLTIGWEYKE